MAKFRKKPIVIEAVQWHGYVEGPHDIGVRPYYAGVSRSEHPIKGLIETLEGDHVVTPGDWIITGIKGEKYPCKPDIFVETYEVVD